VTKAEGGKKATCDGAEGTSASRRVKPDHCEQQDRGTKKCTDDNGKCRPDGTLTGHSIAFSGRQLTCFYTNANSLTGKFDEFKLRASKYDIVGVVETWASDKIFDAELAMEGFCLYRKDRPGRVGGGLVLYINDNIQSTEVTDFQHIDFEESVWCRLSIGSESLLVGLIYRSPSSLRANDHKLLEILEVAASDRMSKR